MHLPEGSLRLPRRSCPRPPRYRRRLHFPRRCRRPRRLLLRHRFRLRLPRCRLLQHRFRRWHCCPQRRSLIHHRRRLRSHHFRLLIRRCRSLRSHRCFRCQCSRPTNRPPEQYCSASSLPPALSPPGRIHSSRDLLPYGRPHKQPDYKADARMPPPPRNRAILGVLPKGEIRDGKGRFTVRETDHSTWRVRYPHRCVSQEERTSGRARRPRSSRSDQGSGILSSWRLSAASRNNRDGVAVRPRRPAPPSHGLTQVM